MSTEQNKALSRKLYEEIFSKGNTALIEQMFDAAYVNHDSSGPPDGWSPGSPPIAALSPLCNSPLKTW